MAEADAALAALIAAAPDHAMVWVARARCMFTHRETMTGRAALDVARQQGADTELLAWISGLADAAVRYGV
jgi:hypothetical protein